MVDVDGALADAGAAEPATDAHRRGVHVSATTTSRATSRRPSRGRRWPRSWPPPGEEAERRGEDDPAAWDAVAAGARRAGLRPAGGRPPTPPPCRSRTTGDAPARAGRAPGSPRRRPEPEPEPLELLDPVELRGGLEALLFVMDDPVDEATLAGALRCDRRPGPQRAGRARRGLRRSARPGSRCAGWGRGGGSTPGRSTPPSSSGTSSTGSAAGSPRRRWRPSPSSPTGSRSPAPACRRSAASGSTASCAR